MKKVPMLVMLLAPYVMMGLLYTESGKVLPMGLIAFAVIMSFGALYAFCLPRVGCSGNRILLWCMILKIGYIPIFFLIFIGALLCFVVIIPMIPFLVLFDYFLLLSASMYGVSGLIKCYRENRLSKKAAVLNIVLQFLFCADVFSVIYCWVKTREPGGVNR